MTSLTNSGETHTRGSRPASELGADSRAPVSPATRWAVLLGFLVVGTAVQLVRQPGAPVLDTLWAEDGHLFLTEALADSSPLLIFDPAGPLHAAARLIAFAASLGPIAEAALVTRVLAALTVSLLAAYTFVAARDLIPSRVGRGVLAAMTVALPSAGLEVNASTTNIHWYFFLPCFLALVHRPRGRADRAATWVVLIAAALSEGIVLLLVPVALYRLWKPDEPGDRALMITFLALCAVQLGFIVTDNGDGAQEELRYGGPVIYDALPGLYGMRVVAPLFIGEKAVMDLVGRLDLHPGKFAFAATTAFVAGLAAYVWWGRQDLPRRGLLLVATAYSGAVFLASTAGRGNTQGILPDASGYVITGSRYMLVPTLMLALVVIAVLSQRDPHVPARVWSVGQGIALAVVSVVLLANVRMDMPASDGPTWSDEVAVTRQFCEETGAESAHVRIAPRFLPWVVVVRCDDL